MAVIVLQSLGLVSLLLHPLKGGTGWDAWGGIPQGKSLHLASVSLSSQGCTVETALEAASLHPAQLLGIEHKKGTLDYDSDAGMDVREG